MGSIEKIVDMLNAVVAEGLNDYTKFGDKTKYTKEEVTAKLFETISVRVKAQLDDAFGVCTHQGHADAPHRFESAQGQQGSFRHDSRRQGALQHKCDPNPDQNHGGHPTRGAKSNKTIRRAAGALQFSRKDVKKHSVTFRLKQ